MYKITFQFNKREYKVYGKTIVLAFREFEREYARLQLELNDLSQVIDLEAEGIISVELLE